MAMLKKTVSFHRTLMAAALAAAFGSASAQEAAEAAKTLGRVVVSGEQQKDVQEKTELGKLTEKTPISGAVVGSEEIDQLRLVNNLLELGKRVPGISMIRNMRIPDGGKLYTENRIDGMRAASNNTSIFDELNNAAIERIEVITGPASALYGSGAFGGTLSIFTRQPPSALEGRASQELGSFGFKRTQGYVGNSSADGKYGFVVTASKLDYDGWRQSPAPGGKDAAAEHKEGLTLRGQWRPTDSTKITLGRSDVRYDFRWAGPLRMSKFEQDWRQTEAGTYGQYVDNYQATSFRLQQFIGDKGELTLATARTVDDQLNYGNGGSGGANNIICDNVTVGCAANNAGSAAVTNTIKPLTTATRTTVAMYRQDFDLAKTSAYLGAEWVDVISESSTYSNRYTALQAQSGQWALGTRTATGQGNLTTQREYTPFAHVEVSPLERLRLHLGSRYGRITTKVDDRTVANRDVNLERFGHVARTGATYDLTPDHMVWANWGETFNPQTTGSLVNSANVGTAGNVIGAVLSPERGVTRELGFRGKFTGIGLRYDVTIFDANTNGFNTTRTCTAAERTTLNGGAACTINTAAGRLATSGTESMLSWSATQWLDLGVTYTNSRAYFTDFVTTTFDFTGKSYQAMPLNKLNLRAGFKPAPGWLVELEGDYISSYYVDNTNALGSYKRPNLYNLRTSYRYKDWSFWFHAINLTDRQYATRVQLSTIAGVANVLSTQAGQGNAGSYTPLTLRAGVEFRF
jgi:iron complex outermembrane receptor protein